MVGPPAFAGFASFGSASHIIAKAAAPKPRGRRRAGAGFASFGQASHLVAKAAAPKPGGRRRAGAAQISDLIFKQPRRYGSAISRHDVPELCREIALKNQRAQGTPGARCTRDLVCQLHIEKTHTSIQVQAEQSGIPCAMALRLISCSPRRRIRLVTVASELTVHQDPVGPRKPPPA
jgi:hypothetical protein